MMACRSIVFGILVLVTFLCTTWGPEEMRIFLIGDSTMADKPLTDNPERGWGQLFPLYFRPGVVVENHARNGRSTKSFIATGDWQTVADRLRPGDYLFIQFGHNDAKKQDSTRYAEPNTAYRQNLQRFVREARGKGALPVLLTPVNRRNFDTSGAFVDKHGQYPSVVRDVAAAEHVPLIDLHEKSLRFFQALGPEGTKRLFLWIPPHVYGSLPEGKQDNTHFNPRGAFTVAGMVVEGIRESGLSLARFLRDPGPDTLVGLGRTVGLDCFFNCEWKTGNDGGRVRYHYTWDDTANSGFSILGTIISRTGATILHVPSAPTPEALAPLGVYIIVDPDTPQETPVPSYIDPPAAEVIERWVSGGGVLVLMGNDKGNAEFEHLNDLAGRFGIHFNEDSRHRVIGKNFAAGTCDSLPPHPIFLGVRRIYLKEVSSLSVSDGAEAVLNEEGSVLMACARYGSGMVFAVGDPWLYNEYIDSRKLPPDYDNAMAGENLFRWLLNGSRPTDGVPAGE
jgi:lysophospholipase L1-like esterase